MPKTWNRGIFLSSKVTLNHSLKLILLIFFNKHIRVNAKTF